MNDWSHESLRAGGNCTDWLMPSDVKWAHFNDVPDKYCWQGTCRWCDEPVSRFDNMGNRKGPNE